MKRIAFVLGLAGLLAAIALVAKAGLGAVMQALRAAGWPLLWLVPLHVLPLALDAAGWRALLAPRDGDRRARWPVLLAVATVREAVNRLLPVAGVGGELVGIRIVTRLGVAATPVAASVVTEVVLTLLSLVLFAALGGTLLFAWTRGSASIDQLFFGILLALPVPMAGLWLINEGRLVAWIERCATLVGGFGHGAQRPAWLDSMPVFQAELSALARRRGRLALACLLQLLGMIAGAVEVWLALRLLGHPVGAVPAVIIESVVLFVRNLAFAVPAGLGAQEAGIVLIGAAVGLDQELAIGLALAKRMREVLFGVPALLGWHLWESLGGTTIAVGPTAGAGPSLKR
jgi:putative membrane protein